MDKTYAPIENKSHEKIKVESIDIVVTGPKEKPYYAIKYRKVGSNDDCIGYGSYTLEYVLEWKEQCFELVERKSDWIPISERLPDTDEYVLLSFKNYTMAAIGRYEENDEGGTFIREMMKSLIQAMEYLSMHGCHYRSHTGKKMTES
ncbi:DUF551 domain-containing protein [bacterium 210928-DFI.3.100]|nr:DUF551 domain-containing protein [bacterium 210928-DFI.3.100]